MERAQDTLRVSLWNNLKAVYEKYEDAKTREIPIEKVKDIVTDVLDETTIEEQNYVIRNMFRLDANGNGSVDFMEFGNFLFKRHCGEMSLQRAHRDKKIKNGGERKILPDQFWKLINGAFSFLNVSIEKSHAQEIIQECDKDGDGMITYVEYFQFIEKTICFNNENEFKTYHSIHQNSSKSIGKPQSIHNIIYKPESLGEIDTNLREWNGRLRLYLWAQLKKLYDAFIKGRSLPANDEHLKQLIISIIGDVNSAEMTIIQSGLFGIKSEKIQFIPFAIVFFYLVAQIGLSRFQQNHAQHKKKLNCEEFILVLKNTFKCLSINKVKSSLLKLIFEKIDTDKDGEITFDEYVRWINLYMGVEINLGDEFYLLEDDGDIEGDDFLEEEKNYIEEYKKSKKQIPIATKCNFTFSNFELSGKVRIKMRELYQPFDRNKDNHFEKSEIIEALTTILKQNESEIPYFIKNVFRYNKNNDDIINLEELTDFSVEQHFGEMAIQRLHRKNHYSRGKERIMNQKQFQSTLNYALDHIGIQASPAQAKLYFSEIDLEKNDWIPYEIYFLFMKHYFGTLRPSHIIQKYSVKNIPLPEDLDNDKINQTDEDEKRKKLRELWANLKGLDRFIKMLIEQLKQIFFLFDVNHNSLFEADEIEEILLHVFNLNQSQIKYTMSKLFNLENRKDKSLSFDELVKILLETYFIDIYLKEKFSGLSDSQLNKKKISQQQFIELTTQACFFIEDKPYPQDLIQIFKLLDTDKDKYITFLEYLNFIKKYLGYNHTNENNDSKKNKNDNDEDKNKKKSNNKKDISAQELAFVEDIWNELKTYFDKYDSGKKGHLVNAELEKFVKEVLGENSKRQLDYIFWNLFRFDPNVDSKITFDEFAPFIINHTGEISLQRFHLEQIKGKSDLKTEELSIVFENAFSFLSSMKSLKAAVPMIYKRVGKGKNPSYGSYLSWIYNSLAKKFN